MYIYIYRACGGGAHDGGDHQGAAAGIIKYICRHFHYTCMYRYRYRYMCMYTYMYTYIHIYIYIALVAGSHKMEEITKAQLLVRSRLPP